jgi:acetyl-CoA carboxylase carboxyltransferase component
MRKGAVLAVSSSNVTSVAIAEDMDAETLGGWRLHSEVTGFVDAVVDSDEDAIAQVKTFLSYLPDNASLPPPVLTAFEEPAGARTLDTLVPESRTKVYDIRNVIRAIADKDTVFPLKERFAKVAVTALGRIRGRTVGFIASNPMFKGGALDPDACDKITSFIVLCDSFNIPLVFLADTPGFLVGAESEKRRLPGKIMNFMAALEMSTVPKIALVLRKSYGQAYLNMGGGKADVTAAWFSGDISFMDPAVAVNVVHGIKPGEQPEQYDELLEKVSSGTTAYELAAPFMAQMVIDPNDTRDFLAGMLEVLSRRMTNGVGEHRLSAWPPAF